MRTIAHFAVVSLKYFFDIDYLVFDHVATVILVIAYSVKLRPMLIINELHEGLLTIKDDIIRFKSDLAENLRSRRSELPS